MPRATLAIQVQSLAGCDDLEPINAAIGLIQASGFEYEVGSLETTIEGDDAGALMRVAIDAHRAAIAKGADAIQSNIRLLERPSGLDTMRERVAPYRKQPAG